MCRMVLDYFGFDVKMQCFQVFIHSTEHLLEKKIYIMLICAHFGCRLMVFGIKRIKKYSKINVKSNILLAVHVKKSS